MKHIPILLVFSILIAGCSPTKLIQQYKNPDAVNFNANKVLIIGVSADKDLRLIYEKRMVEELNKKDVAAVKSIDLFEKSFTNNEKKIEQLNEIEKELFKAGYDAILITKITDRRSKISMTDSYRNFAKKHQSFEEYYYNNQHIYLSKQLERNQVYTTETSLYCICPEKERELLWRGEIDVVDATKINRNINSIISVLLKNLKANKLLLRN
ncbi:hypothetical protein [Marinirhabdus gelatinilytica]|uniref:Cardiolipin synthetase n=1 Tax=Marinirhabdus gelatinilytica TaxID=1703343 RepID=A0A370QLF7_9FLAO|nr:hypothetical protein [Marinirhabdus gelatinilytica]RDK89203.1 hypothetical protein C8D94_1011084 [Marinirhabdus gelatinilytica]